jgi:hypothetical protein
MFLTLHDDLCLLARPAGASLTFFVPTYILIYNLPAVVFTISGPPKTAGGITRVLSVGW